MNTNLQVGQKLWWVPFEGRGNGGAREVVIKAIGRKWADLAEFYGGRMSLETMITEVPNYGGSGRCYLDKVAWERERERKTLWRELREIVDRSWNPPSDLSADTITSIIAQIKGPSEIDREAAVAAQHSSRAAT